MKTIIVSFLMLLLVMTSNAMTVEEFANTPIGTIVSFKYEWNGKTYLEGESVICFKVGTDAWINSTNPNYNFSGRFPCKFFNPKSIPNADVARLQAENRKLLLLLTDIRARLFDITRLISN